jgi:xanthosine phosphorylase
VSLAVIAGSGLAGLASVLQVEATIPFEKIPGVNKAMVAGHAGEVLAGAIDGHACLCSSRPLLVVSGGSYVLATWL